MNSADIKREILQSSDSTGIRKKLESGDAGINSEDVVEMGQALEQMTQSKGWSFVEAYIINHSNPVGLLFAADDPVMKGKAQALILLMQWVQQTILAKNNILAKGNKDAG
jgi:hypothetical protein